MILRLEFYGKRREHIIKVLTRELAILESKVRFINEYIDGAIELNRKSRDYILSLLEERGYPKYESDSGLKSYDYLVKMPLIALTLEKIDELNRQTSAKKAQLDEITGKTERDLWREDLNSILALL